MTSRRVLAVIIAVVAGVLAWFLVEEVGGVDLAGPGMSGRPPIDITAVPVGISALVATLVGWGLLALIERRARNPRRTWTVVVVILAVLSLGAPFSGSGIETSRRLSLALLHVVVAVVFIPLMARTAPEVPRGSNVR